MKHRETASSPDADASTNTAQPRQFEHALADVEQIVCELESGRLDLSRSLEQYQRGVATLKECYELLSQAERRISLLSGFDADGKPVLESFDPSPQSIEDKQKSRATRRGYNKKQDKAADTPESDCADSDDAPAGLF